MPPLRLVLVSPLPPPPGGIATWTRILLRELEGDSGVEVFHVDTAVRWRGVTQLSAPVRLAGGSAQAVRDYLRFRSLISRGAPHVVHICTSAGPALMRDLWMLRLCRVRGIPAIVHYRMGRIPRLRDTGGREWALLRRCTETAARALVLDRRSERVLREACPEADVQRMPNMVDLTAVDEALGSGTVGGAATAGEPATPKVAYAGHVLPSKGVTDLVQACALLGRAVEVHIAGPAEEGYRKELEALAGESVRLRFRGTLSHAETLRMIAGADVFALPSHSEGFPNAVAEAMACGVAVLGTNVGAIPDMLNVDGDTPCGVCVEPHAPEALAAALERLLGDAELRRAMGLRGRRRAEEEYAAPVVTLRLKAFWRETADLAGGGYGRS